MLSFEYDTLNLPEHDSDDLRIDLVLRNFMHDIADFARESFQRHVPLGDTGRTYEAISEGRVNKTPYGYSVEVGIEPIELTKKGESPDYPLFVHEGTGMFSDDPHWITPTAGNVMVFEVDEPGFGGRGRTIFTRNVEGQPAQPYLDDVEAETHAYIEVKKQEVARLIEHLLSE